MSGGPFVCLADGAPRGGYDDVPMLKPPVWTWEVAVYFFLGGLSSGAYLLSRAADRCNGRLQTVVRAGAYVAAAATLPCPPLLISDLGDPYRFHHMLRVFKPRSPMNVGTWTLAGYSGIAASAAFRQWSGMRHTLAARAVRLVEDAVGVPLALLLGSYTGVLLSCTSVPVWSRNPWLGAVFASGGFHNGCNAVQLALDVAGPVDTAEARAAYDALDKANLAASVVEGIALAGFLKHAAPFATPVTRGQLGPLFWGGAIGAGLVLPTVLQAVEKRKARNNKNHRSPWIRIATHALGLVGGFALRWAMLKAGAISASDPEAARQASR